MKIQSRHRAIRGQVLVLLAVGSLLLVGFLALAVDVGYLLSQRRGVQNAADAGALAAALSMLKGETNSAVLTSTAAYYAGQNGYAVTPIVTPDFVAKKVRVDVTYDVPKFFLGAVYHGAWRTSAHAVAKLEPEPVEAAILALNPNGAGIVTSGSTVIEVTGGGVMSNSVIQTAGYTRIESTHWVNANKGFQESGGSYLIGAMGTDQSAPVIPDPLSDKISPPVMPAWPTNPVPNVNPGAPTSCPTDNVQVPSGTYTSSCSAPWYPLLSSYELRGSQYRFDNAGIGLQASATHLGSGTFNFVGGSGITGSSNIPGFSMEGGKYSFTNGAGINLGGTVVNSVVGGDFYFSGGGGFTVAGQNSLTLNPGTYIFDGGAGFTVDQGSKLNLTDGEYTFYFRGANFTMSGNSPITLSGNPHVKMYFLDGSRMIMGGSTDFSLPSGEYYFDGVTGSRNQCGVDISGSTAVSGHNVFFYFGKDCNVTASGTASYGFTAPTTQIYPGYYPGVFMYANPANTKTFQWNGSTRAESDGIIYLPSSTLAMGDASDGKVFTGQIIVSQIALSGGNSTELHYKEYVEISNPAVYLIE